MKARCKLSSKTSGVKDTLKKTTGMFAGFREFIARGNAVDLAVGVVIGAAFGEVINALVDKFLSPLIGALFGQPSFDNVLQFEIGLFGDPAIVQPGAILTALFNFLIVALALYFAVVLPLNKLAEKKDQVLDIDKEEEEEEVSPEVALLTEIRDSLREDQAK